MEFNNISMIYRSKEPNVTFYWDIKLKKRYCPKILMTMLNEKIVINNQIDRTQYDLIDN